MEQGFDVDAMIERFRERAAAVRQRGLPPVEGTERQRILRRMQLDFQDFAMVGDAEGHLENGVLTLRVDLRPKPEGGGEGEGDRGEGETGGTGGGQGGPTVSPDPGATAPG